MKPKVIYKGETIQVSMDLSWGNIQGEWWRRNTWLIVFIMQFGRRHNVYLVGNVQTD